MLLHTAVSNSQRRLLTLWPHFSCRQRIEKYMEELSSQQEAYMETELLTCAIGIILVLLLGLHAPINWAKPAEHMLNAPEVTPGHWPETTVSLPEFSSCLLLETEMFWHYTRPVWSCSCILWKQQIREILMDNAPTYVERLWHVF